MPSAQNDLNFEVYVLDSDNYAAYALGFPFQCLTGACQVESNRYGNIRGATSSAFYLVITNKDQTYKRLFKTFASVLNA